MGKILFAALALIASLNVGADAYRSRTNPLIFASGANITTSTADTNENTITSFTIPGGSMGPNGWIEIGIEGTAVGGAGNITLRGKLGAKAFMAVVVTSAQENFDLGRVIRNNNAQNVQTSFNAASNAMYSASTSTETTGAIDTSVNQTFTFTSQKGTASDAMVIKHYFVKVYYAP